MCASGRGSKILMVIKPLLSGSKILEVGKEVVKGSKVCDMR